MQILKSTRLSVKYCCSYMYYMHYRWIVSIITPVFSVTWSFRNYSNMLICCLGDIYCLTLGAEQSVFLVTAAIVDKIKHIHFQKESKHRFLLTISALPLCSQSAHLFQPLATRAEAWQAIPGVSAVGNDNGKTSLYTPICSKTTALPRCARGRPDSTVMCGTFYTFAMINIWNIPIKSLILLWGTEVRKHSF